MYHLNVWLTVNDAANIETVRGLLSEAMRLSRAEPGCARFDVYHSEADPSKFLLVEWWQEKADWEAHRTRKAVTEIYVPKVLPLVKREPHVSVLLE
jgi:quinol monooxygenase YgiN